MRHIKCTCGLSDGNDDKVIFCTIENISYDRKKSLYEKYDNAISATESMRYFCTIVFRMKK